MPRPVSSGRMRNLARPGGVRRPARPMLSMMPGSGGFGVRAARSRTGRHALSSMPVPGRSRMARGINAAGVGVGRMGRVANRIGYKKLGVGAGVGLAVATAVRNTGPGSPSVKGRPTGVYKF